MDAKTDFIKEITAKSLLHTSAEGLEQSILYVLSQFWLKSWLMPPKLLKLIPLKIPIAVTFWS